MLDDIRAQRIPVDYLELFDQAKVPYYDGAKLTLFPGLRDPDGLNPTQVA